MKKDVAELFKTIGDSFLALSEIYSSTSEETATKEAKPKKQTKAEKPAPVEEKTTKTYSKEDVRAALSQKAKQDGCKYKADVKNIVTKYSTDGTLTQVPEDKYSELMAELEVIGNA